MADIAYTGIGGGAATARRPRPDIEAVTAFSRERNETGFATDWRRRAAVVLDAVAYPDRVEHLWRYTDPDLLLPRRLLATDAVETPVIALPADPALVLAPGRAPRLNEAARASGLSIQPLLSEASHVDLVGRAVPAGHGYFEALNAAAFDTGVCIRAPRGFAGDRPLRVIIPAPAGRDVLPRLLVKADRDATLTVVEEHTGGAVGSVVVGVTEIIVEANAEVRHVLVQRWADGVVGHLTQRAYIERDARFVGATAGFGGSTAKLNLGGILAGPGARSELVGVTLPERRQHLDHHTAHQHRSGHTWSNIDFKAAITDRARSVYTGLIRIEKDAPGSEAFQENRNLLLSERARADTIPELEILTDDVSCSHGATAAPVDPEQLFYLQSRGMSAHEAVHLIVRGFVEPTLRLVPAGLREELGALVERRLRRMQGAG